MSSLQSIPSKKDDLRKAFEDLQAHSSYLASFTLKWRDLEDHFDSIEKLIAAMASLQSISVAIESTPSKKDDLRKSFEDLQSHSSSISSFTLNWRNLEDHFDCIEKSIEKRFKDLESAKRQQVSAAIGSQPSDPATLVWPEMKSLCSKMDGKGLQSFLLVNGNDGADMRRELDAALQSAYDPAKLVLDAMEGFCPATKLRGDKDAELKSSRRACNLLLWRLAEIIPLIDIKDSMKDRAKKLAFEWKGKIGEGGDSQLESMVFLQLLQTFGLVSAIDVDELLEIVVIIARRKQAIEFCRALGLTAKIPDLIKKFISKGKQLDAVNFAYAFELVDKYPPIPLLKAYLKEMNKVAQEVRKKGKHSLQSMNESTDKEFAALKAVVKSVEDHNLQSEYPCDDLNKRIARLEKQKADRKRSAAASAANRTQPSNKRPRQAAMAPDTGPPLLPQMPQASGLLSDRVNSYAGSAGFYSMAAGGDGAGSSSAGLYGLSGGSGTALVSTSPYALAGGPVSSGQYGFSGGHGALSDALYDRHLGSRLPGSQLAYGANLSPPRTHLTAEALSSSLYDRPTGYGGYPMTRGGVPPQYNASFYTGF